MKLTTKLFLAVQINLFFLLFGCKPAVRPDMILFNGKVITVDQKSTIAQALAVKDGKIIAVGTNDEIKKTAGTQTQMIDVKGKTIVPGLYDGHLHPETASVSELIEKIPDIHTIAELLSWIKSETEIKKPGEWIVMPKMFFTRLRELRSPTLTQLDSVAPKHPVFLNGSYGGMINSCAIKVSQINKDNDNSGLLKDKKTGELTGILRAAAFRLIRFPREKNLSYQGRLDALQAMLSRYNEIGITSICSGANDVNNYQMYVDLHKAGKLTVRVFQNVVLSRTAAKSYDKLLDSLKALNYKTGTGDEWVKYGPLKIVLDGGILTGTAYMREPWGDKAQEIFGITDPTYRGVVNFTRDEVLTFAKAADELNWKFTAHSTGGGGVDLLLDVYDEVNKAKPIKDLRWSIIHGNFFTKEAIEKMKRLGVYADAQPAWFYKDADAMKYILGDERIKTFQNYRTLLDNGIMVNGGSDHMVGWDSKTSINPFNPFLAMYAVITRKTERGTVILPEEAITREEALKMYTINNAYESFDEKIKGTIEPGKLADMAVLSADLYECPAEQIKDIVSDMTIVGGKIVYQRK
jgi:predicted amidohydrolase YtcJ